MPKLIVIIGLPGSGKSTYAKNLTARNSETMKYLSSDKIREELYGDESICGDPNKVFRIMQNRTKDYLNHGYDVVYDATNVTRKNRRNLIQETKKICSSIEAHVVWALYDECIKRDELRPRHVGKDVIHKFLHRWQSPYYDEGFTVIKIIYNTDVTFNSTQYKETIMKNMKTPHDNSHHRLSIYEHSIEAYTYALRNFNDSAVIEAALYHDIGKPATKCYKSDVDGNLLPDAHYYQHDAVGGYLSYGLYYPCANDKTLAVSWLISNHMQPYFNSNYYKDLPSNLKLLLDQVHEADEFAH